MNADTLMMLQKYWRNGLIAVFCSLEVLHLCFRLSEPSENLDRLYKDCFCWLQVCLCSLNRSFLCVRVLHVPVLCECFCRSLCVLSVHVFCFVLFCFVCVCVSPSLSPSCRKQSSWRESDTVSTPQWRSTLSQTPPSFRLPSTRKPRVQARKPTGLSHLQLPASPSHLPRPPLRHQPQRAAAGLFLGSSRNRGSRRSKENRGLSMKTQIQKMVLISAWLKTNRLRRIKLLQQHRVRILIVIILFSCISEYQKIYLLVDILFIHTYL